MQSIKTVAKNVHDISYCQIILLFLTPMAIIFSIICIVSTGNNSYITKSLELNSTAPTLHLPIRQSPSTQCKPFKLNDTRAFFEREPPQKNLPRPTSDKYKRNLRQQLKSLRIAVVGCAKNVEKNVDTFRENIEPIVDLFHPTSKIFIFESDSTDGTLEKLRSWKRAHLISFGNLRNTIPRRVERLAVCRNELLQKARDIQVDYMLVVDIDIFAMNVTAFLSNFDWNPNEWSVMTGNLMKEYYYDIWALRTMSESVLNFDCWHRIWALNSTGLYCVDSLLHNFIHVHQIPYPPKRGLLEVRSAFGGVGLYRMNSTEGCQYNGDFETCEHVPFHTCIRERNNARIFFNPRFVQ